MTTLIQRDQPDGHDGTRARPATDLPRPAASRLPQARWLDARLLVGLLLVLASVVAGATVVAGADDRVAVWSVTRDLGAGSTLGTEDVRVTSVRLDDAARAYVAAGEDVAGSVLARPVGRGELLPVSALSAGDASGQRRIVIEVDRYAVAGLAKGRLVDVYVVPDDDSGEAAGPPEQVLAGVTVGEDVRAPGGGFGGGTDRVGVTLLVDEAEVPDVIDAVAHGSVYVVHVPGTADGR